MFFIYFSLFHPSMIILIPGLIIAAYAQYKVSSSYEKYLRVANTRGISGAEAALKILNNNDIYDVQVELVDGKLSDHYDPRHKVLRLSKEVYHGRSLASVSIAAHEAGHAIQHNVAYMPLRIRSTIAPVVSIASQSAFYLFIIGLIFNLMQLVDLGIIFFSASIIFNLVTLPVEFNASSRAISQLTNYNLIYEEEVNGAKNVLGAAALTYVAATIMSFLQLMRLLVLRGSRD